MNMLQYLNDSARTAAEPVFAGNTMYKTDAELSYDLVHMILYGMQADLMKRATYYKTPHEKLAAMVTDNKMKCQSKYDFLLKLVNQNLNKDFKPEELTLIHAALGLMSEASEIIDAVLTSYINETPLDYVNINEELGDSLWYVAMGLRQAGSTFEKEGERNINKLKARYPDKFSAENAENRNLQEERKVLEKSEA